MLKSILPGVYNLQISQNQLHSRVSNIRISAGPTRAVRVGGAVGIMRPTYDRVWPAGPKSALQAAWGKWSMAVPCETIAVPLEKLGGPYFCFCPWTDVVPCSLWLTLSDPDGTKKAFPTVWEWRWGNINDGYYFYCANTFLNMLHTLIHVKSITNKVVTYYHLQVTEETSLSPARRFGPKRLLMKNSHLASLARACALSKSRPLISSPVSQHRWLPESSTKNKQSQPSWNLLLRKAGNPWPTDQILFMGRLHQWSCSCIQTQLQIHEVWQS